MTREWIRTLRVSWMRHWGHAWDDIYNGKGLRSQVGIAHTLDCGLLV